MDEKEATLLRETRDTVMKCAVLIDGACAAIKEHQIRDEQTHARLNESQDQLAARLVAVETTLSITRWAIALVVPTVGAGGTLLGIYL